MSSLVFPSSSSSHRVAARLEQITNDLCRSIRACIAVHRALSNHVVELGLAQQFVIFPLSLRDYVPLSD
jgi:hypothetical protein